MHRISSHMNRSLSDELDMQAERAIPKPGGDKAWVVAHTRPRCEKKLISFCQMHSIHTYLPLLETTHRYGGRIRRFSKPLFTGYVFALTGGRARTLLRQNRYVANLLETSRQAELVQQLRDIYRALAAGRTVQVEEYFESGRRVRIIGGPLRGVEGVIVRRKNETRVLLKVDLIRQAVSVEVNTADLMSAE